MNAKNIYFPFCRLLFTWLGLVLFYYARQCWCIFGRIVQIFQNYVDPKAKSFYTYLTWRHSPNCNCNALKRTYSLWTLHWNVAFSDEYQKITISFSIRTRKKLQLVFHPNFFRIFFEIYSSSSLFYDLWFMFLCE